MNNIWGLRTGTFETNVGKKEEKKMINDAHLSISFIIVCNEHSELFGNLAMFGFVVSRKHI